jgi:hypothetical protein
MPPLPSMRQARQTIQINSSIALNNLTIEGTNAPTVQPVTGRLTLLGNLIIEDGATYTSNNLSLSIGGNYENNGIFTSSTSDTTYFDGTAQTLSGTGTNTFHHFVSVPVAVPCVQRHITITGNMAIVSGTLPMTATPSPFSEISLIQAYTEARGRYCSTIH